MWSRGQHTRSVSAWRLPACRASTGDRETAEWYRGELERPSCRRSPSQVGDRTGRTRPLERGRSELRTTRLCLAEDQRLCRECPGRRRAGKRPSSKLYYRPSDRRGSGNTRGRNMRSRCRCSMCPAIHINSRSWLRSSSTHEPSDPPLRVVSVFADFTFFVAARPCNGWPGLRSG